MILFSVPVLVNYLASHVSLAHNECRQCEIVKMYNDMTTEMQLEESKELTINTTFPVQGKCS